MDKKEELISTIEKMKNQYSEWIYLKGAFFCFNNSYYPIKLFFIPYRNIKNNIKKELDYGDLLLIENCIDIDVFNGFIKSLGDDNNTLKISSHQIEIPKGFLRSIDEDSNKISQQYGRYQPLSEFERKLLLETHSFPKSFLQQWPSVNISL